MAKTLTRTLTVALMLTLPSQAMALYCSGIPQAVKMGEFGGQEAYAIVRIGSREYRLGLATDDATKVRVSLAQTALVADKVLTLRFYGVATCNDASVNNTIPNSTQLVGG